MHDQLTYVFPLSAPLCSCCRRQKHTFKAVAKHKLQQQLKDPTVRLNRLRAQLGSSAAPATRPAAKTNSTMTASCSSAADGGRAGRRVSADKPQFPDGSFHGNSGSKHQQHTTDVTAVRPLTLARDKSSASSPVELNTGSGSTSTAARVGNAAHGPPYPAGDQETRCHNRSLGPARSCSQKQQQLPLALPSLAPSTKACTAAPSAASPASGVPRSLPKLVLQ